MPRSSNDPLQRLDQRDLIGRIQTLEQEMGTERKRRAALAYDQQTLLAQVLRIATEIILLQSRDHSPC
jgi:hypothetical protein